MHQNMGQFVSERPGIFFGRKIAVLQSPAGYGINHPPDHLADAMFPLRTAQRSTEVLRDDHVGGHLRPGLRDFNVRLLEDNLAPFVDNGRRTQFPFDLVVGIHPLTGKIPRYF